MSIHLIGIVVALRDYLFWFGAILLICALGDKPEKAAYFKAIGTSVVAIVAAIAASPVIGEAAEYDSLSFLLILMTALPAMATAVRWWQLLQPTPANANHTSP